MNSTYVTLERPLAGPSGEDVPAPARPRLRLAADVASALRCPRCCGHLSFGTSRADCVDCRSTFPVSRGVPVLIDGSRSLFRPEEVAAGTTTPTRVAGVRRILPSLSLNRGAAANYRRFADLLTQADTAPLVLSVGGGEGGTGSHGLTPDVRLVTMDVAIGEGTAVAADAHQLPFASGIFDGVVAQAVLEHVVDPATCVEEIFRVLKPRGVVYAETPFMQQVHMGRFDFTRFTELGHRRLFRRFEQIAAGPAVGPGSALAWSLTYFLASWARTSRARRILAAIGRISFFWLRYTDVPLAKCDASHDAAAGFFFIGRKSTTTLSDQQLVNEYRGGIPL